MRFHDLAKRSFAKITQNFVPMLQLISKKRNCRREVKNSIQGGQKRGRIEAQRMNREGRAGSE